MVELRLYDLRSAATASGITGSPEVALAFYIQKFKPVNIHAKVGSSESALTKQSSILFVLTFKRTLDSCPTVCLNLSLGKVGLVGGKSLSVQRITAKVCKTKAIQGLRKLCLTDAFVSYLNGVLERDANCKSA